VFTPIGGFGVDDADSTDCHDKPAWCVAADHWFQALDQRMVAVGADCWTLHVMGIHPFRRTLWIQLHRAPDSEPGLVLKVSASTRLEEALDALHGFQWHESGLQVVDATGPAVRKRKMSRARLRLRCDTPR
jgi:hypothetical protein